MEIENTLKTLHALLAQPELLANIPEDQRVALMRLAGQLSRPSKIERQLRNRTHRKVLAKKSAAADRLARVQTGIRRARESQVFVAPEKVESPQLGGTQTEIPELNHPHNCYVCKCEFKKLHFFYDSMCPKCANFNYEKRFQSAPLTGQVAIITGARLKIGYHAALMMLRSGAKVIVTTRFPADAAIRYASEPDYETWRDRLEIYALDLRHSPSVDFFCKIISSRLDRLDILINNAAQTVRRPPGFYAHLLKNENLPIEELPPKAQHILKGYSELKSLIAKQSTPNDTALAVNWQNRHPGIGLTDSARLSQIPYSFDRGVSVKEIFPEGHLDADLQQVDLRTVNSWRLKLGEIPAAEMIEVQLVNSVAPFILCNQLLPLMRHELTGQKHIVNVTAMEGKFYRFKKEDRHPHTNMAKAALNMLTHTAAADLEKDGIYINAVDTGWVTDEDPVQLAKYKVEVHDFQPPLDIVDGAARICDPFFDGINTGRHWSGKFLKDYFPIDW